jgi:hypothetical protein
LISNVWRLDRRAPETPGEDAGRDFDLAMASGAGGSAYV